LRGIDAVSVRDLDALGDTDLLRATSVGRVLVTADNDFLYLANVTDEHSGIIFDVQEDHSLGDWVKNLELICLIYSPQDMKNRGDYSGIETE